jgi:hypothetical protein
MRDAISATRLSCTGCGHLSRSGQTGVPVRVRCSVSVGESEPQFAELGGYLVGGAYEEARQGGRVGAADGEDPAGVVARSASMARRYRPSSSPSGPWSSVRSPHGRRCGGNPLVPWRPEFAGFGLFCVLSVGGLGVSPAGGVKAGRRPPPQGLGLDAGEADATLGRAGKGAVMRPAPRVPARRPWGRSCRWRSGAGRGCSRRSMRRWPGGPRPWWRSVRRVVVRTRGWSARTR